MATIVQIAQDIIKDKQGGQLGDQPLINQNQVFEKIRQLRISVYSQFLASIKYKRYDSSFYMRYKSVYDKSIQYNNQKFVRFAIPKVADLPKGMAIQFAGSNGFEQRFPILQDVTYLSRYKEDEYNQTDNSNMVGVIEDNQFIDVYGNPDIKTLYVMMCPDNPMQMPILNSSWVETRALFDEDLDQYPIGNDLMDMIKDMAKKQLSNILFMDANNTGKNEINPLNSQTKTEQ